MRGSDWSVVEGLELGLGERAEVLGLKVEGVALRGKDASTMVRWDASTIVLCRKKWVT